MVKELAVFRWTDVNTNNVLRMTGVISNAVKQAGDTTSKYMWTSNYDVGATYDDLVSAIQAGTTGNNYVFDIDDTSTGSMVFTSPFPNSTPSVLCVVYCDPDTTTHIDAIGESGSGNLAAPTVDGAGHSYWGRTSTGMIYYNFSGAGRYVLRGFHGLEVVTEDSATRDATTTPVADTTWGLGRNSTGAPGLVSIKSGFRQAYVGWVPNTVPRSVVNMVASYYGTLRLSTSDTGYGYNTDRFAYWDMSNVEELSFMFWGSNFNGGDGDIGDWNVRRATVGVAMFQRNTSFTRDVRSWPIGRNGSWNGGNMFGNTNYPTTFFGKISVGTSPGPNFFNRQRVYFVFSNVPNGTTITLPLGTLANGSSSGSPLIEDRVRWTNGSVPAPNANILDDFDSVANNGSYTNAGGTLETLTATFVMYNGTCAGLTGWDATSRQYLTAVNTLDESVYANWGFGYTDSADVTTTATITAFDSWFSNCSALADIPNSIPTTITSAVSMFDGATNASLAGCAGWDTTNVTDLSTMFRNAAAFNRDIRVWTTSTTYTDMFDGATAMQTTYSVGATPTSTFFNQTAPTLTFTFTNVPDGTLVSIPLSGGTNLGPSDTIAWNGGAATQIETGQPSFTNDTGNTIATLTAVVSVVSGYFTRLGGIWANGSYLTSVAASNTDLTTKWALGQDATGTGPALTSLAQLLDGISQSVSVSVPPQIPQSVTSLRAAFRDATAFNQNIAAWKTGSVTDFSTMFQNATTFNQYIRKWSVIDGAALTNMFDGATAMDATYSLTAGYGATPTLQFFNYRFPCFLAGTDIETDQGPVRVENLRPGTQVKTFRNGFLPIIFVGSRTITHLADTERVKDQLYVCTKSKFPEATRDLVVTGCHSLLFDREFHDDQEKQDIERVNGGIYLTDGMYRFPACTVPDTDVFPQKGSFRIYHFALANPDYYMNYGVYANGILVESASQRYMKECSNMDLLN